MHGCNYAASGRVGFLKAKFSAKRVLSVGMNAHTFFEILETFWRFAVRSWSGIGPLVGVLIGAGLTHSWQRKQWVLENKKAEWRELINTLSESYHCMVKTIPSTGPGLGSFTTGEDRLERLEAELAGFRVIEDRIFIDKPLRVAQIRDRWALLAGEREYNRACAYWRELHDTLVRMAHRDLGIKEVRGLQANPP